MSETSEIPPTPIYLRQSMVERVAREICSRGGLLPDRILGDSPAWQSFEPTARAVPKVMREPNLAMRKACSFKDAEITWPAMIDAALETEA